MKKIQQFCDDVASHPWWTLFFAVLIIGGIGKLSENSKQKQLPTAAPTGVAPQYPTKSKPEADKPPERDRYLGKLRSEGGKMVTVAVDKDTLDEATRSANRQDAATFYGLIREGRLFLVEPDTSVRIIDPGFARTQIRILEGSTAGREGWVPSEWVVR